MISRHFITKFVAIFQAIVVFASACIKPFPVFAGNGLSGVDAVVSALSAQSVVRSDIRPLNSSIERTVLLFQDIHAQPEAQQTLGKMVSLVFKHSEFALVGLEGAFSDLGINAVRANSTWRARQSVADYLLRENKISGIVHATLLSPKNIPNLVGVDDEDAYNANVNAYLASAPEAATAAQMISRKWQAVREQKRRALTGEPARIDAALEAYQQSKTGITEALSVLRPYVGELSANLRRWVMASEMERIIDFRQLDQEREKFISDFDGRRKNIGADYPALALAARHSELVRSIDFSALFNEMRQLEKQALGRVGFTDEQIQLIQYGRYLFLASRLVAFSLTPDEWIEYKLAKRQFRLYGVDLTGFERFYEVAEIRDRAMADNLLSEMEDRHVGTAVLVVGGFHSPGIERHLMENGVRVVTFSPRIKNPDLSKASSYLRLFTKNHSPLESAFEGLRHLMAPSPYNDVLVKGLMPVAEQHLDPGMPAQKALKKVWPQAADKARVRLEGKGDPSVANYTVETPNGVTISEVRFNGAAIEEVVPLKRIDDPNHKLSRQDVWKQALKDAGGVTSGYRNREGVDNPKEIVSGSPDQVISRLNEMGLKVQAEILSDAFKQLKKDSDYKYMGNMPITLRIVENLGRTALVDEEGRINLDQNLLRFPSLLYGELEEEVGQIFSRYLWRTYRGLELTQEEKGAEELHWDLRKLQRFMSMRTVAERAKYLANLMEFDMQDNSGYHTLFLRLLAKAERRRVIADLLSYSLNLPQQRLSVLQDLEPFFKGKDKNKWHEKTVMQALVSFYQSHHVYSGDVGDYYALTDHPQRAEKHLGVFRKDLRTLRGLHKVDLDGATSSGVKNGSQVQHEMKDVVFAIFAGGLSTRLWPLPKALIDLMNTGLSLVQSAYWLPTQEFLDGKFAKFVNPNQVFTLTVSRFTDGLRGLLVKKMGAPEKSILEQPGVRGTVGALIWTMAHVKDPKKIIANINSDHMIHGEEPDERTFLWREAMHRAARAIKETPAGERRIVALGNVPPGQNPQDWPRFGLHKLDSAPTVLGGEGHYVTDFVEAASAEEAAALAKGAAVSINAGYYMARLGDWEALLEAVYPDDLFPLYKDIKKAVAANDKKEAADLFLQLPTEIRSARRPSKKVENSIAYGLLEPLVRLKGDSRAGLKLVAVRSDFIFDDIGNWLQFREMRHKKKKVDAAGNILVGNPEIGGLTNSIVFSQTSYDSNVPGREIRVNAKQSNLLIVHGMSGEVLIMDIGILERDPNALKKFVDEIKVAQQSGRKQFDKDCAGSDISLELNKPGAGGSPFLAVYGVSNLEIHLEGNVLIINEKNAGVRSTAVPAAAAVASVVPLLFLGGGMGSALAQAPSPVDGPGEALKATPDSPFAATESVRITKDVIGKKEADGSI